VYDVLKIDKDNYTHSLKINYIRYNNDDEEFSKSEID